MAKTILQQFWWRRKLAEEIKFAQKLAKEMNWSSLINGELAKKDMTILNVAIAMEWILSLFVSRHIFPHNEVMCWHYNKSELQLF